MLFELLIITLGSFVASFVNAMFATGGIYILLAAASSVLPLTAAIPLLSAFAFSSLAARLLFFRRHIRWRIVAAFAAGASLGVLGGASMFISLDEAMIAMLLGMLLLVLTWMPHVGWRVPFKHPFVLVGGIHAFLGTLFGVGAVLQPAMLRTDLLKAAITGTLAACLLIMDLFKITGYVTIGFDYSHYLYHILLATGAGFVGTWCGKRLTHRVSEQGFRQVFRWLVTLIALRMLYQGVELVLG